MSFTFFVFCIGKRREVDSIIVLVMIYFISDYHFYHALSLFRSRTQFRDVGEMNDYIVSRHNSVVENDDTIYILGDVIVCDEVELKNCLKDTIGKMAGHKHLILGNHDYRFRDNPEFLKYFESVQESKTFKINSHWIQLYHYPVLGWYRKYKGGIHIYGHMHDDNKTPESKIMSGFPNAINVSVEVMDYKPVSFDKILAIVKLRKMIIKGNYR